MSKPIKVKLIEKGVHIPNPESVFISEEIDPERISASGVTIHAGCKLFGAGTLISANCEIGREAPVTLEDTCLGEETRLNGGSFTGAVFAGGNVVGSNAQVRAGTIFEEEACAAHTVGLKQTILFPFVTLGSLINFCDCFMAGGTSRKNHSEVGSSFIHFNYTPNQDKATASMLGDVHQGVMLDKSPIFLGGQGGLVGPVRIAYGCITAAGSIIRNDEKREDRLMLSGGLKTVSLAKQTGVYRSVAPIYKKNIQYISALMALNYWYLFVRPLFAHTGHQKMLVQAMQDTLRGCIKERVKRLSGFGEKLMISRQIIAGGTSDSTRSIQIHDQVMDRITEASGTFLEDVETLSLNQQGEQFVEAVKKAAGQHLSYVKTIRNLSEIHKSTGRKWLLNIEETYTDQLKLERI